MLRYGKVKLGGQVRILMSLDLPSRYVFSVMPIGAKEPPDDNMFQVDKKTGKVSEFSPHMDLENFGKAMDARKGK